jgi:hypothetical protein
MERARHGEFGRSDIPRPTPSDGVVHRLARTRENRLGGGIEVRGHDMPGLQQLAERFRGCIHGRHGARLPGGRLAHEPPTCLGQPQQVVLGKAAGRAKRDELAVAVPRDHLRLHTERAQDV